MALEKTEVELRKEINELLHQQREITERLRDPRGLRRGGPFTALAPRNGARQRHFLSHGEGNESEDQPPAKRRLSSAVVKVEDGELLQDDAVAVNTNEIVTASHSDSRPFHPQNRTPRMDSDIPTAKHIPRVLPKNEDSRLVNRNKRMLGQLLGTLEKFRKEDMQLSGTEAYMRRSNSLQRAEQRAREESERLRIEEREQIAEKRKRDLTLMARVAAKTEEKKLELLFLQWSEHHKKLSNFIRTKAEPPIYYLPKKPLDDDAAASLAKSKDEAFLEWKNARREELMT
ncbi:putative pinin/SDK/MemA protein [Lupinus albus]|uniref:Putative pinin/SDK/MemA protein n=1 Tax=Lupinus albus TaxID=3870 RepID=A0A6A4QAK1_LUPAL|nr:putative pinin/SDK/MemA protein [Lupinus albus]